MSDKKRKFKNASEVYKDDNEYRFNVLLPNGVNVPIVRRNPVEDSISVDEFVEKVRKKCSVILSKTEGSKRKVFWDSKELFLEDCRGNKIRREIRFEKFKPNKTHLLKLFDGAGQAVDTFENMWDLTPDTDLLTELPDDYTFETALADLIDNSLQAVWSNGSGERKLISVEIDEAVVSVSDTGPGMDGSDGNSIVKWGKMGASIHRSSKKLAVGGKPPFLTPFFGMFGYGGTIASMHLGRHAVVSAKTKDSKEVYWLRLERDALLNRSGSAHSWKAPGGIRQPSDSENEMSPHGSFTKIVMKPKLELPDIYQLQCKVKDIYFPYIQCDEISKTGRTTTLVEFQINGINLTEIEGGEVAVTNLHSCNGPDFVLNLHFSTKQDNATSKSTSVKPVGEGNARLKCVYFPIVEGKENIDRILEKLNDDGFDINDDFETLSRISIRRLGRLLPDARWGLLPFMKPKQKRGPKVQTLKKCCSRVKCFIDTDAGFDPIPSKTDLAPQHPFTKALKDLGSDAQQKEKVVSIQISKDGKQLTMQQLEREYLNWIHQMHSQYDDETNLGDDEPTWLTSISNKAALHVTSDVVRVHEVISWKGKSWSRGQRVKFLKGACAGCHKNNVFATLEYFLLEGFDKDAGGEVWIICRPLAVADEDGSVLTNDGTSPSLELHSSLSLSIIAIESGKCVAVSDDEWNGQVEKMSLKRPSMIEVLGPEQSKSLDIDGGLPADASVSAGSLCPKEIAAVLRPSNYSPSSDTDNIDQKHIIKDNYEMCLDIKRKAGAGNCSKTDHIFSGTTTNTSRKGCPGLYVFPVGSIPILFQKAGDYSFSFSLKNSATATVSCEKIVKVKALSKIKRWELSKDDRNSTLSVCAGSSFPSFSVARYDEFDNIIPFKSIPEIEVRLLSNEVVVSRIKNVKPELSLDKLHMIFPPMRIATDKLDNIRPNYEATLGLSLPNKKPFLTIRCLVFPGPIRFVHFLSLEAGKELLPDQVLEDIRLEMLDKHQNHVKESEVELELHGFRLLDQCGLKRTVDVDGFLDLSSILKVTEGYGKPVSLSIKFNKIVIFTKKFQVGKRELRLETKVPELCHAGSILKDIAFVVVNSEGQIDPAIHHDDKHKSHTLKISTEPPVIESLRYAFQHGRCVVPSITLPQREGTFSIEVFHCRHRELRMKFEVNISRSLHTECTASDLPASEEVLTRKGSELQDSDNLSGGLENQDDDMCMSQPLDEEFTSLPVSDVAKHVKTSKGLESQDLEDTVPQSQNECAGLSPFQTSNMEDAAAETPVKLSDPNDEHGDDLCKTPEGKLTLLGSNLCDLEEISAEVKLSDPNIEHGDDLFESPEGKMNLLGADLCDLEELSPEIKQSEHVDAAETPIKLSGPNDEHDDDLCKTPEGKITLLGSNLCDLESDEKEVFYLGSKIKETEKELKWCTLKRHDIKEELTQLGAAVENMFPKEVVLETIENKVNSAASIYSTASQKMALEIKYPEFSDDVVGLVAFMATAPTPRLSRSLAEYLGEDKMLGIVCKSSAAMIMPEKYEDVLVSLANELRRDIKGQQIVLCLEDIRAFDGDVLENDGQRRLSLPNPALPDGTTPPGFLGYAVNLINIDVDFVQFRTVTSHGLRETLFYELFGELQVYETKEHMRQARSCITNGAVSLDGRIIRGKGIISLGSERVDVLFPVAAEESESLRRKQIMKEIEERNNELKILEKVIESLSGERDSYLETFHDKKNRSMKRLETSKKLILSQQSMKCTPMAPSLQSP